MLVDMLHVTPSAPASSSVADAVMPASASSAAFSERVLAAASVSVAAHRSSLTSVTDIVYWIVVPVLIPSPIVT